jgi:hypothetical protein
MQNSRYHYNRGVPFSTDGLRWSRWGIRLGLGWINVGGCPETYYPRRRRLDLDHLDRDFLAPDGHTQIVMHGVGMISCI